MSVFLYHAVVSRRPQWLRWRERKYWMDAGEFRRHLALLGASKHPVVRLADCWRATTFPSSVPSLLQGPPQPDPLVLTFDDGWQSDYSLVWPLLLEAGIPATFFVNTQTLGQPGHLRWSQVRKMSSEGASFQSHGHRHVDLTRLDDRALETELRMSKDLLEGWVKTPVEFLAAPYGRVSRRVVDTALEAGYQAVCTSDPRPAAPRAERVSRVAIHAGTKPTELAGLIESRRMPYWGRSAQAAILAPAKLFLRPPSPKRKFLPETA
ncbi:MAG TPA: polysaccharide deacetylase family protein [Patescibacteria group bacterium]|nr:polysaccharide deacetylase family protein [Patescibacteria group bacterium]